MASEKLVLTFPRGIVRVPVVYHLVKDHDLKVNIMRASISPDEAGHMVVEISGDKRRLEAGRKYMESVGVQWQLLSRDVHWLKERCVHCTACVSVCPTSALHVKRPDMEVKFDGDKCIGCELCIPVCIFKAVEIKF